jgi:hypothetical protein
MRRAMLLAVLGVAAVHGCGGGQILPPEDGAVSGTGGQGGGGGVGQSGSTGSGGTGGTAGSGGVGGRGGSGGSGGTSGTGGTGGAAAKDGGAGTGGSGGSSIKDGGGTGGTGGTSTGGTGGTPLPPFPPGDGPAAGNPDGKCEIPAEGQLESVAAPRTVVGNGTPESCTGDAFVAAVARGGVITFSCGPQAKTITLDRTAKIVNDTGPKIVIDGGGKVTLSGGGKVRILYQNTCDQAQKWTTGHCDDQDTPQLTLQNLTFADGNARNEKVDGGGGGAVFVRGGRLKIINSRFFRNVCDDVGPDVGGAAVRALSQSMGRPVYVVGSTFGGADGYGNVCSNGGGLSSIGVSYAVINSLFTHNRAIGVGANPARPGTPGGGSGGAIYNDGDTFTLALCGTRIATNKANEGGGAIFYVSNDRSGSLTIRDSALASNPSGQFETAGYPGIFVIASGPPQIVNSTLTK